jgi:SAM-dependent methyltransferase
MSLPDTDRLDALAPEGWRALGRRLKSIGYAGPPTVAIRESLGAMPTHRRAPIAKWHARRAAQPWGAALRMLLLADPVTEAEARAAVGGEVPIDRLLEAGVLERIADGLLVSPYTTSVGGGSVFLCDSLAAGDEAVMGPGGTTQHMVRAAYPRARIRSALDLGCGAGTAAILLAAHSDRVVGTDISERAVALARVNAWLNDVGNVEFRVGDMYAPVEHETFDLVVSQPPFIARPEDAAPTTFLFGGSRGDELPMRVVRGLTSRLAPGGTAVLLVEWPVFEGDAPLEQRLREGLGAEDSSLLLLVAAGADLRDERCERYATLVHPTLDDEWERMVFARRDHLERLRLLAFRPSFTVVRRSTQNRAVGWTSVVEAPRLTTAKVTRAHLDALVAARDLEAGGTDALRKAWLRVPSGVKFSEAGGRYQASFGEDAPDEPMELDEGAVALVQAVDAADTVGDALDSIVRSLKEPGLEDRLLAGVRQALLQGLLEVA